MFKSIVFLALSVAACYGAPGTYCSVTPSEINQCLNIPNVISHDVTLKCTNSKYTECEKMTCLFRESKWLDGTAVNKAKVSSHFDQFGKDKPEWSSAIQHMKAACLEQELKTQGAFLNCPAYDVVHCALTSFIKHATPSQWSTSADCTYPWEYAANCPVCPIECFASQIPIGSCNACFLLPRSP